ncbi:MAG: glycosyltransferase family 1 protein [Bryobacteraceae bacterium]
MPLRVIIDVRHLRDFGIGTHIRNLVHGLRSVSDAQAAAELGTPNQYVLVARASDREELADLPSNFSVSVFDRHPEEIANNFTFPAFLRQFPDSLYHMPLNSVAYWMPKPYIVTVHDMSSLLYRERGNRDLRARLHELRFRRGLARAARIVAVSNATRRDLEDVLGTPSERIRRIYNAPDPLFLQPPPSEALANSTLERYQIRYPFLLYTGTIRPQKNVPRLVEAFAVLRGELEQHPVYKDLRLIIIGDELSKYPAVRRAVIQSRVEQSVRFLGFVPLETLRIFYGQAEAFVFPSLYEGFGLPPLEAMACGTPVVTSNVSSLPEVVGDAAMMVNPEKVFDIARGIREVLLDPALRADLVERGRDQLRRFSWENTAREFLDTYHEVASAAGLSLD